MLTPRSPVPLHQSRGACCRAPGWGLLTQTHCTPSPAPWSPARGRRGRAGRPGIWSGRRGTPSHSHAVSFWSFCNGGPSGSKALDPPPDKKLLSLAGLQPEALSAAPGLWRSLTLPSACLLCANTVLRASPAQTGPANLEGAPLTSSSPFYRQHSGGTGIQ